MREEDDIANILNNTEIESFDIKQKWLDDMSSQLDAYNSRKAATNPKNWWLKLLLIPALILPMILLSDSEEERILDETTQQISKTELIENTTDEQTNKESTVLSPSRKENYLNFKSKNSTVMNLDPTKSTTVKPLDNHIELSDFYDTATARSTNKNNQNSASKKKIIGTGGTLLSVKSSTAKSAVTSAHIKNNLDKKTLGLRAQQSAQAVNHISTQSSTSAQNQTVNEDEKSNSALLITQENNLEEETEPVTAAIHSSENAIIATETEQSSIASNSELIDSNRTSNSPENTETTPTVKSNENEDTKVDVKNSNKRKLWSIGFTLGPDLLEKKITENTELLNFEQKKSEEIFDNTWGFDFETNRYLTSWLAVGSGIGFKKYQEINSYSISTSITNDTTTSIVDNSYYNIFDTTYFNQDSTWTVIDTVLIEDIDTITNITILTKIDSSKRAANGIVTSSYVQIPINAQFIFINAKRMTAYTNMGLTIGLLTKNTGRVVNYETNEIVTYTTRKMIYTSSIGLGFNYNIFGPLDYKLFGAYQFHLSNLSLASNVNKKIQRF